MKDAFVTVISDDGKTRGNTKMFKVLLQDGAQPVIENNGVIHH
jgi:hypothetical protein